MPLSALARWYILIPFFWKNKPTSKYKKKKIGKICSNIGDYGGGLLKCQMGSEPGPMTPEEHFCPRKEADPLPTPRTPSWGSRHSGFMQIGRHSSRNSCVSAALVEEVLELLLEIHPNRTWGTPGRLHSPCSGGKNHIQIGCSSFKNEKPQMPQPKHHVAHEYTEAGREADRATL